MSRYTGPKNKRARRVGISLRGDGKDIARRPYAPGQHGQSRRSKPSEYGNQLKEKQKLRFTYGMSEKQFRNTFEKARKMHGVLGEDFLKLLESRLDNIVFRLGFSRTRCGSRQLVNHGHIKVNGQKVDIPSYQARPGDVITLKEKSIEHPAVVDALQSINGRVEFVSYDEKKHSGKYLRFPERAELTSEINESLIVEFYNR